jgi:hypothetical protein
MPNIFLPSIVARWRIFKTKIPILVNFEVSCNCRFWYILCPFGPTYSHFVHFVAIWFIVWLSGIIFPILVRCTENNLAILLSSPFACFTGIPRCPTMHSNFFSASTFPSSFSDPFSIWDRFYETPIWPKTFHIHSQPQIYKEKQMDISVCFRDTNILDIKVF